MKNKTTAVPAGAVMSPTLSLVQAAMIAAIYVVLTFIANALGLASYAIQVRFSEALTILPYFTPAAIPGLFIGCLLSNILTGCALPDIVFGSLATLAGAVGTYVLRKWKWCAPVCPIIANTLIVPLVLIYGYGLLIEGLSTLQCYGYYCLTVGAGEFISCGILGMILLTALQNIRVKYSESVNSHILVIISSHYRIYVGYVLLFFHSVAGKILPQALQGRRRQWCQSPGILPEQIQPPQKIHPQ